jgi:hypothetical protein
VFSLEGILAAVRQWIDGTIAARLVTDDECDNPRGRPTMRRRAPVLMKTNKWDQAAKQ